MAEIVYTREKADACAKAGAAFLDKTRPGWRSLVDVRTMRMSSCTKCIWGQVFGDYMNDNNRTYAEDEALGFITPVTSDADAWATLGDAWVAILRRPHEPEDK